MRKRHVVIGGVLAVVIATAVVLINASNLKIEDRAAPGMAAFIVPAQDVQAGQSMDALIEADQLKLIQVHLPTWIPSLDAFVVEAATDTRQIRFKTATRPIGKDELIALEYLTFQTFDDGTWVVGEDIKPGTYRNPDPSPNCYWERVRNVSGGLDSSIANGIGTGGPIVVEILRKDAGFTSQGCGEWTSDLSRVSPNKSRITDGMWIMGADVADETYRSSSFGDCYWERMRDFQHGPTSILASGVPHGDSAIVEVKGSDAGFTSQGCGTWMKV